MLFIVENIPNDNRKCFNSKFDRYKYIIGAIYETRRFKDNSLC